MKILQWLAVAIAVALQLSCGDAFEEGPSGDPACAQVGPTCDKLPWCCPASQTCWINSAGSAFSCHNAGQGQAGASCLNYLGSATCGPGLACYQLSGQAEGVCSPYCSSSDPNHACPNSATCMPLLDQEINVTYYVCQP